MATSSSTSEPVRAATAADARREPLGESRWPPALALLVYIALTVTVRLWLPSQSSARVVWLAPAIETGLLVAIVAGDPAHPTRQTPWPRRAALALVLTLVGAALWATTLLIYDLVGAHGVSRSASRLLASGAVVWTGNNLAFGLLYWLLDGGGPRGRAHNPAPVDFAFTQQLSPELAPPGWRPVFLDYLHLGFTNATAFSPTDVMPLTCAPST